MANKRVRKLAAAFVLTVGGAACGGSQHTTSNPPHVNPPPPEQEGDCDKEMMCAQAITCVDGQQYPTACGPKNCDAPMGPCDDVVSNPPPPENPPGHDETGHDHAHEPDHKNPPAPETPSNPPRPHVNPPPPEAPKK